MKTVTLTDEETANIRFCLYRRLDVINQDHLSDEDPNKNGFWTKESKEIRNLLEKLI